MTPEMFTLVQEYLIQAFAPFIEYWIIFFVAGGVLVSLLIVFLVVSRGLLTRFA